MVGLTWLAGPVAVPLVSIDVQLISLTDPLVCCQTTMIFEPTNATSGCFEIAGTLVTSITFVKSDPLSVETLVNISGLATPVVVSDQTTATRLELSVAIAG